MVVDASVIAKWFLDEPGSEAARRYVGAPALKAPDLLIAEVLNTLWVAARTGRFSPSDMDSAIQKVDLLIDTLYPSSLLAAKAFEIAQAINHPIYDCLYLAAAVESGSLLVTADKRLLASAQKSAWATNVVALA